MKRVPLVVLSMVAGIAILISACGSSSPYPSASSSAATQQMTGVSTNDVMYDGAAPEAAAGAMAELGPSEPAADGEFQSEESVEGTAPPDAPLENRKIVRHGYLSLESMEFDRAITDILSAVTAAGGYVEKQDMQGVSIHPHNSKSERFASISVRVPSERLDEVTGNVGKLCNILSQNERMEDITDSYFDAQAHLESLQIQEDRLLEILKKAEKLEDIIALEQALSETRYRIESLTASLKRMDSQVSYSYLDIELREVFEYTDTNTPRTFTEKLSSSFMISAENLSYAAESFLLSTIENLPTLLFQLLVLFVIVMILYIIVRWFRKRVLKQDVPGRAFPGIKRGFQHTYKKDVSSKPTAPDENSDPTPKP